MAYDFRDTFLGDTFGGFLNEGLDLAKEIAELQIKERVATGNASIAQYQHNQNPNAQHQDGSLIAAGSQTIAGIQKSTLLYVGGFMLLAGAGVALYKSAT